MSGRYEIYVADGHTAARERYFGAYPRRPDGPAGQVPPDQIVVHVKGSGKLDINVRDVTENDYVAELKKRLDPRQESERVVFFVAEEKVNYGRLVWAVDSAKMAGAQTIGIATDAAP